MHYRAVFWRSVLKQGGTLKRRRFLRPVWIARRGPGSGLSALHEVSGELSEGVLAVTERGLHDTFVVCVADRPLYREQEIAGKMRKAANERFHVACSPFCG